MNLELMISEFESEDVIVTSCGFEKHYELKFDSTEHKDHYDVSVTGFEPYNKVVIGTDTYDINTNEKDYGKIGNFENSLGTGCDGFYHVVDNGKLVYCKDKN